MCGQEVRSADNTVVVPLDLRLPQESESEKYAAYMLGLSFPFPLCSQECASSESCFSCHSLRVDEDRAIDFGAISLSWRHWRACMQTRAASAQERILGGLSSPVIRDVVGVRSWYPLQDGDEIDPEQQSQSLVLRWACSDPDPASVSMYLAYTSWWLPFLAFLLAFITLSYCHWST